MINSFTHRKYVQYTKEAVALCKEPIPKILKTDCWNEAEQCSPIAPLFENITLIEILPARIEKAKKEFSQINIIEGNIQKLPFQDNEFDVLLDLSTIDHVEDPNPVLDEYNRVLKPNGIILIVAWFGITPEARNPYADTWQEMQYYFDIAPFRKKLQQNFTIVSEGNFPEHSGMRFLYRFLCRKK